VPVESYLGEAAKIAALIAKMPPVAVRLAKESINRAYETHLDEGLHFERKNFYLLFASTDQKEGMRAFIDNEDPEFTGN
jgi:enoyl-CoA hydratase